MSFFRIAALLVLLAASAFAQTASVTGRVVDSSGSVVPSVTVSVIATASGAETAVQTNDQGYYVIPSLLPGTYNIVVSRSGFQTIRNTGLALSVQQAARLDFTLQVGTVSETVEVSAQSVVLDSETATTGQVVQSKQITELPLLGRNTYALAMLVPGVRPSLGVNNLVIDQISTVSYVINGQRASNNEFLLDGAPNSAPSQNQPVINANPDMVQEFKVETNNFSAEYGRASGGVFNVVTKSGSNDFHFSAYEFLRNEKLNASDFFANLSGRPKPPFKFNQFGGTFGGPVVLPKLYNGKNRTFFFFSSEIVRFVQGITFTGTVPTADQLAGNFSSTRNAAGNVINIFDPLSGATRTAFPGNQVPKERFDAVASRMLPFFPAANAPGNPVTGVNNYARVDGNRVNKDAYSIRADHYFSERNRFFSRYSRDITPFVRAAPYGLDNPASPGTGPQIFARQNGIVEDTETFNPTLIGTFRYSITRLGNVRRPFSEPFDITKLGFSNSLAQQVYPPAFPFVGITGYGVTGSIANIVVGGVLGATDLIQLGNDTHAAQAQLTKTLSRHTLKAGYDLRVVRFNIQQTGANTPNFNFNAGFTQGPNPTAASAVAGQGFASFLLGLPASAGVIPAPALAQQTVYHAAFLQDSFRVNQKLTLNAGLRWEYESPRTDRFNQLTNFDFNATPPLQAAGLNLRGGLTFVGVNGAPRQNANPDRNNFGPRAGLAYKLTPKTVLRAGGGIFYASFWGVGTGSTTFGIAGFQASTNMVTTLDGITPLNRLNNPYPTGLNQATGSSLGLATLLGQPIGFYDRGNRLPYSGQWNFNIQQEMPHSVLVEVGYLGSVGKKLYDTLGGLNQLPDSALALRDDLRTQVPNPFFGKITGGILAQPNVARAQLLRPYPHFDSVTSYLLDWSSSNYNALTAKVEKRYARGLTLLASYTYSKMIDYSSGTFAGENLSSGGFQNFNNLRADRSSSGLDQTQRFLFNTVYEVPFFKGGHGVAKQVLGGWQLGTIVTVMGGGPLGITAANNTTFSQGGGLRPNWTGTTAKLDSPTWQRWFDTSQFTNPAPYTFGNLGRTLNGLRSDATKQLDLSLNKNFALKESLRLQFRAEAFNLTNTARFSPPNTTFGTTAFGVVSSQENLPRIFQFALKLIY